MKKKILINIYQRKRKEKSKRELKRINNIKRNKRQQRR